MRVDVVREGGFAEACLPRQKVRDREQYGPYIPASTTRGVDVVEIGWMRTNQLHFKADETALAVCLIKLWPRLPKDAAFGYERLQNLGCHSHLSARTANDLPVTVELEPPKPTNRKARILISLSNSKPGQCTSNRKTTLN